MTTRHLIPISGKDSLCTAIVQTAREPDLPYEYLFNDTGAELPPVHTWLQQVETYLGQPIIRLYGDLPAIIAHNDVLPSNSMRYCTGDAKITPMEKYIGHTPTIIYYGLRHDEPERVGLKSKSNVTVRYPLREMGIGLDGVMTILQLKNLMPPTFHWQRLENAVRSKLLEPAWVDHLPPIMRHQLFAWRTRANCYFCFYQRLYEWVGLLEHYPDLFQKALLMEQEHGGEGYTWMKGYPLTQVIERQEMIFNKRVGEVSHYIANHFGAHLRRDGGFQVKMFADPQDDLAVVSCGLLCGK